MLLDIQQYKAVRDFYANKKTYQEKIVVEKTVGQAAVESQQKDPETRDPIELEREIHKDYEKNLSICIDSGIKNYDTDFFVVVLVKKERLLENVLRNLFLHRSTCPSPEYDQSVYKYHRTTGAIEFIWVVPSKETCEMFTLNALQIVGGERSLLTYVLDFSDGTLLRKSKELNGERMDTILPILNKGNA